MGVCEGVRAFHCVWLSCRRRPAGGVAAAVEEGSGVSEALAVMLLVALEEAVIVSEADEPGESVIVALGVALASGDGCVDEDAVADGLATTG